MVIDSSFEDLNHESIRKWYHRSDPIFIVGNAYQEVIAVNVKKVKINGKLYILREAIDISICETLGVWVTKGRALLEAESVLKYVLRKCENILTILVDSGPWYKPALERRYFEWGHIIFGLRNPIEQWFFLLKHRIKLFYRNWSYHALLIAFNSGLTVLF